MIERDEAVVIGDEKLLVGHPLGGDGRGDVPRVALPHVPGAGVDADEVTDAEDEVTANGEGPRDALVRGPSRQMLAHAGPKQNVAMLRSWNTWNAWNSSN